MPTSTFLAIDLGSTAVKFVALVAGEIVQQFALPIPTYRDAQAVYQKCSDLQAILQQGFLQLPRDLRETVTKIGLSSAMHSVLPVVDGKYERVYLWSDTQALTTMQSFVDSDPIKAQAFYHQTGTPLHPMSPFAKLLHLQKRTASTTKWYGLKEWLVHYLTGKWLIDHATASATGLFDTQQLCWSKDILAYLNVTTSQLATLVSPLHQEPITSRCQQVYGLPKHCQVIVGASDGCLAAYASYYTTNQKTSVTIGTSIAVRTIEKTFAPDHAIGAFSYYLTDGLYVAGLPSNNGGCVIEWGRQTLFSEKVHFYEQTLPVILGQTPGAKGIRFIPYLNGERAPHWLNHTQKAGFDGLDLHHTRMDMMQAISEGVGFLIRGLLDRSGHPKQIACSGRLFEQRAFAQWILNVWQVTGEISRTNEPALGIYYLSEQPIVHVEPTILTYQPKIATQYDQLYALWNT